MSSLLTKNVTLKLSNLAQKPSDKAVEVDSVRKRKKIDPVTHQVIPDEYEGFALDFIGVKGGTQTVKLPQAMEGTIQKIEQALKSQSIVKVNFGNPSTLRGRFYAMLQNGQLIQGITASAETVEIISIDSPELDDFDDADITI